MTEEAQRLALVGACPEVFVRPTGSAGWNYNNSIAGRVLPCIDGDPLKDLNAIYEAEWASGPTVIKAMRFWLWQLCDEMTGHSASPKQRVEAFLRAKGLWVE